MTTKQTTPLGTVLVARDIAKARNEVLIEFPDRQRRRGGNAASIQRRFPRNEQIALLGRDDVAAAVV